MSRIKIFWSQPMPSWASAAAYECAATQSMDQWAASRKLYTSVPVTPALVRVPTQWPLVPSFTSVVVLVDNFSPCLRISRWTCIRQYSQRKVGGHQIVLAVVISSNRKWSTQSRVTNLIIVLVRFLWDSAWHPVLRISWIATEIPIKVVIGCRMVVLILYHPYDHDQRRSLMVFQLYNEAIFWS